MRRAHRNNHARIWMVLVIVLPAILIAAMVLRQQGPTETPAVRIEAPAEEVSAP